MIWWCTSCINHEISITASNQNAIHVNLPKPFNPNILKPYVKPKLPRSSVLQTGKKIGFYSVRCRSSLWSSHKHEIIFSESYPGPCYPNLLKNQSGQEWHDDALTRETCVLHLSSSIDHNFQPECNPCPCPQAFKPYVKPMLISTVLQTGAQIWFLLCEMHI